MKNDKYLTIDEVPARISSLKWKLYEKENAFCRAITRGRGVTIEQSRRHDNFTDKLNRRIDALEARLENHKFTTGN